MNSKWSQSNSWALLGPQPVECHCHPLWLHLRSLVQRQLQAEKSKLWQLPCCVPWCRQVSSDTVAVLERFSGQTAKTEWWQVLGTQEMLFPDLVSNLLGPVLWFKFEHTSCEETKIILQFAAHFQLPAMSTAQMVCQNLALSYQSQSTTAAQNSCCHFALDQGDTHKKVPKFQ